MLGSVTETIGMKIKTKRGPRRMRNQRVVPRPKFDKGDLKLYKIVKDYYYKLWA